MTGQKEEVQWYITNDKSLEDYLDDYVLAYLTGISSFLMHTTKGSKAEVDFDGYAMIDDKTFIVKGPKGYTKVTADCVLPIEYLEDYFMLMRKRENLPKPFALHFSKYTFS